MGMPRKYNSKAEKQAAYRQRTDVTHELRQIHYHLRKLAAHGLMVTIDPISMELADSANTHPETIRKLASILQEAVRLLPRSWEE